MTASTKNRAEGRRTIWLLTGTALALAVLVVLAGLQPSAVNWGVHLLGFLSPAGIAIVVVLLLLSLLPSVQTFIISRIERWSAVLEGWSRGRRRALSVVLLCCAGVLFWFARQRTYLLGDGFLVIRTLGVLQQTGDVPGSFPTAPLAAMVAWQVLRVLEAVRVDHAAMLAWQFLSIAAGLVSLAAIWRLCGLLWSEMVERIAGFVLLGAAGGAQLLFGYVETYPAAYAALWVYVVVAVQVLRGEARISIATLLFMVLCFFHLGMAILLPSLLYLWVRTIRQDGWRALAPALAPAVILLPVMLWLLHYEPSRLLATAVRDGAHMLPLTGADVRTDPYTLFSIWHIADVMNLFLMLAPFSLLMMGAFFVSIGLPRSGRPDESGLWYALGFPAALWLCLNSFELGMSRDWDLAAPFGMMVVAGALAVWHHVTEPGAGRQRAMILMALFTAALTGGWITINADTEHSRVRFERLLDPRLLPGSALADAYEELGGFYRERQQLNEAAESFARCVVLDSTNARRWTQLGGTLANGGKATMALRAYERAMALGTKDPFAYLNAGIVHYQIGHAAEGMALVRKSLDIDSACAPAALTLGTLLMQDGLHDTEALTWLERAAELEPSSAETQHRVAACRARIVASRKH
jgi:hypothetical protein